LVQLEDVLVGLPSDTGREEKERDGEENVRVREMGKKMKR
jgi:hypothetical protein